MIEIDCQDRISESVAFLVDGKHFLSGGLDGKIRRWRVEDGKEAGIPMEVKSTVLDIAVSRDGKWVVCATIGDGVTVWNAESHEKVPLNFKTDTSMVFAIDVSPDGTKIAVGAGDLTACVLSLSTGERLLDPLGHDNVVVGVKFSPDGRIIATATEDHSNSVRIYDSQNGSLRTDFTITISDSASNQSLAWAGDSKQLFALSRDGNINCLDVSTGTILSQWSIQSTYPPTAIALASNGTFIAAAADTSVSFWDTTTYEKIGTVIQYTAPVASMTLSANYDIVTTTGYTISILRLCNILPTYVGVAARGEEITPTSAEKADLKGMVDRAQGECANSEITRLEQEISRVKEENAHLKEAVKSLLADVRDLRDKTIATLENTVQDLHAELTESKRNVEALRARDESSDMKIARLEAILRERFQRDITN